ncbi:uncharacterized protein LOC116346763, partial [Contarinia nasturtii]|uniref:uncharacterized protein LOC116346763 n=1 Tax=Contarinia nasturtii TaxID=265458 RepID=UPI0012D3C55C
MLWEKENLDGNEVYIDLIARGRLGLTSQRGPSLLSEPKVTKSDEMWKKYHREGNGAFDNKNYIEAIEAYNQSLCFTENPEKIRQYKKCRLDIKLAIDYGYDVLKLNGLEDKCTECLAQRGEIFGSFVPKLSFDANQFIPYMANVLDFQCDSYGNEWLTATQDIEVGQTLIAETAYLKYMYNNKIGCNICSKTYVNLIPCENCTEALFCSPECRRHVLHKYECGAKFTDRKIINERRLCDLRSVLKAIDLFPNADDLMQFVENSLKKTDQRKVPDNLTSEESKYRVYLQLQTTKVFAYTDIDFPVIASRILKMYKLLMQKHVDKFKSVKHQRFLMHLSVHHSQINRCNSMEVPKLPPSDPLEKKFIATQVSIMGNYVSVACMPNVGLVQTGGTSYWITVRRIKRGERLQCHLETLSTQERQIRMLAMEGTSQSCQCSLCKDISATIEERSRLITDPDFSYIKDEFTKI